jgi:hypothetical protein
MNPYLQSFARLRFGDTLEIRRTHSQERSRLLAQALHLAQARGSADWMLSLRPRARAPLRVAARVVATGDSVDAFLRWMLRRVEQPIIDSRLEIQRLPSIT